MSLERPTYYPLGLAPRPYDVVWCLWPAVTDPAGFKARPALVRQTYRKDATRAVEVAYGTSQVAKNFIGSFYVGRYAALCDAGLDRATRFELGNTLRLPWAEEFFSKRPDGLGPIIGRLPDIEIGHLQSLVQTLRMAGWPSVPLHKPSP